MGKSSSFYIWVLILTFMTLHGSGQTTIPNSGMETWINYGSYMDPEHWDTPNAETSTIPWVGKTVVERTGSAHSGNYAALLETKEITLIGVIPGFMTLGDFFLDITTLEYIITGGVPCNDQPTKLKGYFKYFPVEGDSCFIGIGLLKRNGPVRDTLASGYFSTKDTVADWTLFEAVIEYDSLTLPDSMNIVVSSTAVEVIGPGSKLYIDDLFLDYSVGVPSNLQTDQVELWVHENALMISALNLDQVPVHLSIYDLTGRNLLSSALSIFPEEQKVPLSFLKAGLYIARVTYPGGEKQLKFCLID